jgi:hypothetical protein
MFLLNASVVTNNDKFPDADRRNTKKQYGACHVRRIALYYLEMKKIA